MISAAQIRTLAGTAQRAMEAAYPGTLVIDGHSYTCARGEWRNVANYQPGSNQLAEKRECRIRIRKSLLTADSVTVVPMATSATLDSVSCLVTEVRAGTSDTAFHLTLEADCPAAAQA